MHMSAVTDIFLQMNMTAMRQMASIKDPPSILAYVAQLCIDIDFRWLMIVAGALGVVVLATFMVNY